jgi:uncharacterized protein (DUF2252 family)
MPKTIDPIALARTQLARDRSIDRAARGLFAVKRERMRAGAFAFLRGSAGLFYDMLKAAPELARGGAGEGWLTGDMHLQNFGAYRTDDGRSGETRVVFGPNDFDEAFIGPWRLDVLRLAVSWLLALDERGMTAPERIETCRALVEGWCAAAFGSRRMPSVPPPVQRLVERVEARSKRQLLEDHTREGRSGRVLLRDDHLWPLSPQVRRSAEHAFARYVASSIAQHERPREHFEVLDMARRVAGTGSLGSLRIAVLTRGGDNGEWLFDLKEEPTRASSGQGLARHAGAERVVAAIETCAPARPRMLGTTTLGRTSMLVRRLSPQEDKLDPRRVEATELSPLATYVGALAGAMHRRGARTKKPRAWSPGDRLALVERAITLAGIHEAAYLAYVSMS